MTYRKELRGRCLVNASLSRGMTSQKSRRARCQRRCLPSRAPGTGRIEEPLHEDQVEPAAELVADFAEAGHAPEPEPLVKADRRVVGRVDAADHHVVAARERGGKKRPAGAPPARAA